MSDALPQNRRTGAFERRVAAPLRGCVAPGKSVVIACSGGPDSIATLVAVCRAIGPAFVIAAHFDHGLRPNGETEADAAFVEAVAGRLGARVVLGRAEQRLAADEATAREARYGWLAVVLFEVGAAAVVTGHTRDDQAETVLLNLARGTGLRGASGMRPASGWPIAGSETGSFRVLRPLLDVSREEVEAYLEALGIEARLDPTNELRTYARNRLRHDVLPELETVNSEVRAHLAGFAARADEADVALEEWAALEFDAHGMATSTHARFDRRRLRELPVATAIRVVVFAARRVGLELNEAQRTGAVALASRRGGHLDLAGGGVVRTDARWLCVMSDR